MFNIDLQSKVPIYEQIVNQVERYIMLGILKKDEQLPSVRQIAGELGINPNTIQKAYSELENRKMIISVSGKGNFVNRDIKNVLEDKKEELIQKVRKDVEELKSLGININEILKSTWQIGTDILNCNYVNIKDGFFRWNILGKIYF